MTPRATDTAAELFGRYQALDPAGQMLVGLLAVNVDFCPARKSITCLKGVKLEGRAAASASPQVMKRFIASLVDQDLIVKERQGLCCNPGLRPLVLLDTLRQGRYRFLAERMRRARPLRQYLGKPVFQNRAQVLRELLYVCYTDAPTEGIPIILFTAPELTGSGPDGRIIQEEAIPAELALALDPFLAWDKAMSLYLSILDPSRNPLCAHASAYFPLMEGRLAELRGESLNLGLFLPLAMFGGRLGQARTQVEEYIWEQEWQRIAVRASLDFLQDRNGEALNGFAQALAQYKKEKRKRKATLKDYFGFMHILALIRQGGDEALTEALEHARRLERQKVDLEFPLIFWQHLLERELGQDPHIQDPEDRLKGWIWHEQANSPVFLVLALFPLVWLRPDLLGVLEQRLETVFRDAKASGYPWMAALCADMLAALARKKEETAGPASTAQADGTVKPSGGGKGRPDQRMLPDELKQAIKAVKEARAGQRDRGKQAARGRRKNRVARYARWAQRLYEQAGTFPFSELLRPGSADEAVLKALIRYAQARDSSGAGADQRLVWWFGLDPVRGGPRIEPRLQQRSRDGGWTKGRRIALKRLAGKAAAGLPWLTTQDRRVCAAIETVYEPGGWRRPSRYVHKIDEKRAARELIGHPLVFRHGTTVPVEIVRGEPVLRVERSDGRIFFHLEPLPRDGQDEMVILEQGPDRFAVFQFDEQQRAIARMLGQGVAVSGEAGTLARQAADALAGLVTVQSGIGGGSEAREVEAASAVHARLVPWGDGLRVALLARPLGPEGPALVPGQGAATVLAEVEGERLRAVRRPDEEVERARAVVDACPVLAREDSGDFQWELPDPADCLELVLHLRDLEDVEVEWPRGERFQVRAESGFSQLSLRLGKGAGDWFQTTGELRVDQDLVLDLGRLLELLDQGEGRFIPLDDGAFLALSRQLRRRLEELRDYAQPRRDGLGLNPLATLALEDLFGQAGEVQGDRAWQDHVRRFSPPKRLPDIPSILQAELRPYQEEGFRWLATLAGWGVGACLADDMGLGKTVQALAVLLTLAAEGPVLVVAPLSVVANWEEEAARFAPTFRVLRFGPGDRQAMLEGLGPHDLVLCSYGLLTQEGERLAAVDWRAVVLDEAQAIKNRATKRSRAARNLRAGFRLITTGTPVENHLGELWTLFDFLNPGLLGSFKDFVRRYGDGSGHGGGREARERLRRLIRPFVLRRLKSEVLEELPPRTEVVLRVDMSARERALYEAARLEALRELEDGGEPDRMKVLARITLLRRICCNPALVLPRDAEPIPSSKLEVFGQIVRELIANRHKALVFSQFTSHLALIRDYLDGQGITWQYLDGSTTARQRKERIAAFQAGEGEVFLISLKAGGTGLNLTAADYVIHMDPWWNPAVEDQASDRAHRIGQQRPVTVYRLVMAHTIEEKIVDLHARKRQLADSLLAGADASARLDARELLDLLRGVTGTSACQAS